MWISELSERTQVPIDTIKHYLRIGVLPRGEPIAHRRAEYDKSHVARLHLIRAMIEVGDMRLDSVRRVFDAVDEGRSSVPEAMRLAHFELSRRFLDAGEPTPEALAAVDGVIARRGWHLTEDSTHRLALAATLDTLAKVEAQVPGPVLDYYAGVADQIAGFELTHIDTSSPEAAIGSVVVGTALYEPVIRLLRRMAQEHAGRAWAAETWPSDEPDAPA